MLHYINVTIRLVRAAHGANPHMANPEGTQVHTLEQELDSNLESVDSAEETVLREAEPLGFDEDDLHKIGISVRECMVNAVVHGNRYNAKKKVHLKVERSADSIAIWIADEGEGFDPSDVPDPLHSDNLMKHSGRGVMLMQAFMDQFQVTTRQPTGTQVKMVKNKAVSS
jgi:serine/threonine-protein kinase RsbW